VLQTERCIQLESRTDSCADFCADFAPILQFCADFAPIFDSKSWSQTKKLELVPFK
jgi:hypothetical protein